MKRDHSLTIAIETGDLETVALWLDLYPEIMQQQWSGELLDSAISQDQPAVLRMLMDHVSDVNQRYRGGTLLHLAVGYQEPNLEVIKLLIELGVDPSTRDDRRLLPLYYAAFRVYNADDMARIIPLLSAKPVEIDLNTAVVLGDIEFIRNLLDRSRHAVRDAPQPTSLLRDAINTQDFPAVVLRNGSLLQIKPRPIHEIIRQLLLAGADPNDKPRSQPVPLFAALCSSDSDPKIVDLLLQFGADVVHVRDMETEDGVEGETIWDYAQTTSPEARALILNAYRKRGIDVSKL